MKTYSTPTDTSVGGWIRDFEWNEDYDEVEILDWSMSRGEISSVHAGANPGGWAALRDHVIVDKAALAEIMEYRQAV